MSEKSAMFLFVVGFLFVGFGAGGVEQSITNVELIQSLAVAAVGLAVMGCGVLGIKVAQNG